MPSVLSSTQEKVLEECAHPEKQHEHVPGDTTRDKDRKPGSGRWRVRGNKTRSYPKKSGAMWWDTEVKEVRCFSFLNIVLNGV